MSAGTPIAGDATDAVESHRRRLEITQVYTRKNRHKPKPPIPPPKPSIAPPKPFAADDEVTPSEPPLPPPRPPQVDVSPSRHQKEEEEDTGIIKIDLRLLSKDQIRDLRKKLADELEQVRELSRRIDPDYDGGGEAAIAAAAADEHTQSQLSISLSKPKFPNLNGNGTMEVLKYENPTPQIMEGFEIKERTPKYRRLSISLARRIDGEGFEYEKRRPNHRPLSISLPPKVNCGIIEGFDKEKRTPKANSFYRNSDFILIGKDKFPPPESITSTNKRPFFEKRYARAFKSCAALLSKLMKHKHGWIFNAPVDVKGLGLYDYHSIIKHPMDLGIVKSRLNKNWYKMPSEFAEDVRLTFRNAMTYNPKGQDVHIMAVELSQIFEERWASIETEYLYARYPSTPLVKKPPPIDVRMFERSNSAVNYSSPTPTSRYHVVRKPKPKAKDLYKREMTADEREKLKNHLQNLPQEKSEGVVHIIRKRNSGMGLRLQDEEIEIDIDLLDTETLWELDRYVTNYKKSLSKIKRRAELAMFRKAEAERQREQGRVMGMCVVGEPREQRTALEEKEVNSSLQVGGENRRENAARSSGSSSSDSGSSSDSDSDSSSST